MTSLPGITFLNNIQDGNYAAVLIVVQNRTVNLDERDENGQTFLMEACKVGNTQIVQLLLDQENVNIHAVDNDNWTALLNGAKEGHTVVVHMLCERGAFIEHVDMGGWTALMWGCYKGRLGVVLELLERGANPNVKGEFFVSCLTWAAGRGHTDIVEALLAHGAKVNTADKYGTTPIIWASRRGRREIVEMLVAEGANIDNAGMNSWTALIIASKGGYVDVVEILLDQHPNTNAVDKDGYTALTWAAKDGHYEIANLLVHNGAYINLLDRNGDSILIHAVKGGNVELVKLLLKKYADIDVIGVGEKTALYWAVDKNQFASAKMLLAYNANMEIANKDGDTPLLRAVRSRNLDMVRILLDKGAKVSATDRRGDTPLHICLRAQSKRIAEQLLRNPKDGRLLYRPNKQGETPYQIDSTHQRSILSQILGGKHLNAEEESWSGYDLYSSTIADVLSEPSLHTPMTVGLYAKWGSGKSFLIEKLVKEMQNFTKHNIDMTLEFTSLQFFGFCLVSLVVGLILGVLLRWEVGLGVGLSLLLTEYAFLGLVWFGCNRWEWCWAETLARRLGTDLQLLKLLMQVIFCNEPEPPSRDIVAVKFMFTNNARLASVVGEKSITTMVATLCEALEHKYGRLVTRLYTVFLPVKASRHGRFKTICAIPYFVIVLFILACILAIGLMIASFGVRKFIELSDTPVSSVIITLIVIVCLALLGNLYTWGNMAVSLAVPAKKRIQRIGNELETLKLEGFVQNLKKEVELLGKMTLCLDAFLNIHTRLVVIVDGLDSCDQEKLLQVLDTVNMLFNDMKPFITILAVDPHVIIKGIEHNLQGLFRDSSITGHDYLRNIVHLPFFIQSQVLQPKRRSTEPNIELISSEVIPPKAMLRPDSAPDDYSRRRTKNMFENHTNLSEIQLRQDGHLPRQKGLEKNTYFSDVNPRSLKRLMNIVAVTGRLLRALNVEFNWLKLAAWINLTEQWPYRISWMILEIEDDNENLEDNTSLKVLYARVIHKIPVSKVIDPLLEIDRNPQKLDVFLSNCQPVLTVANIKTFLPCTINVDPYLRKLIREMQENMETMSHDYGMSVASNMGLAGPEAIGNWAYNPRSTPMRLQQMHTPSSINNSPMAVASNFLPLPGMAGMPGVNYIARVPSVLMQHQMALSASPYPHKNVIEVNPRLPRLSTMRVADVCRMITDIDGITNSALPRYLNVVRENNINGAVLLQCDLTELKPVMKMSFGDWELFRRYIEAMREREYTEPTGTETDQGAELQTQFTQIAPGDSEKNGSKIVNPRPRHIEVKPHDTTSKKATTVVSTEPLTGSGVFQAESAMETSSIMNKKSLKKQDSFVGLVMMESQVLKQAIVGVGLDENDQEVQQHELNASTASSIYSSVGAGINERHVRLDDKDDDAESCTSIPRAVFTIDSHTVVDSVRANTSRLSSSGSLRTPIEILTQDDHDSNSLSSFHSSHEHLALRKLAQSDDVGSPSAFHAPPFGLSQPSSRSSSRGSKKQGHKTTANHNDNHSDVIVDIDMLSRSLSLKDSDLDTLL